MPTPPETSVLARIIAAHDGRGPGRPDPTEALSRALTRALRRAAIPFEGFSPVVGDVSVIRDTDLTALEGALPEHGLVAGLEDGDGRRGLVALGHSLVDALIEVQATGKVEANDLPPRPVTRIDESLCRDFIDLALGAFAREIADFAARDWPARLVYGSRISDTRQLNLLFPERPFHLTKVEVTVAPGRVGAFVFALPLDPSLARVVARRAVAQRPERPKDWGERMLDALSEAPLSLTAVLARITLPLSEIEAWGDGSLVLFDPEKLEAVTLEGEKSHIVARGALGQLNGRRAVRLGATPLAPRSAGSNAVARAGAPDGGAVAGPGPGSGIGPGLGSGSGPAMAPGMGLDPLPEPEAPGFDPGAAGFDPDAPAFDPNAAGFDPDAPAFDPGAAGFDPNAMGFDPDAPGFDPNAAVGGLPDLPMGDFDPNAPMG